MLSLDPGGTTGGALIEYNNNYHRVTRTWQIQNGLKGFLDWHWDQLEDYHFDVIVCEGFELRTGIHKPDITPAFIIGAVEALYPATEIKIQMPKLKPLCDNDRLRKMELYEKGKPHAMDAVRHGIIYLRNMKNKSVLESGWRDNEKD